MVSKRDLQKLSADELEAMLIEMGNEKTKFREEMRHVADIYDEKRVQEIAEQILEGLSDRQRQALVQVAKTQGITSEEAVHTGEK